MRRLLVKAAHRLPLRVRQIVKLGLVIIFLLVLLFTFLLSRYVHFYAGIFFALICAFIGYKKLFLWSGLTSPVMPSYLTINNPAQRRARVVVMSDTHNTLTRECIAHIPDGDIFLHAGDFGSDGTAAEVDAFNTWLGYLPHPIKIVIPGNHDLLCDPDSYDVNVSRRMRDPTGRGKLPKDPKRSKEEIAQKLLSNATHVVGSGEYLNIKVPKMKNKNDQRGVSDDDQEDHFLVSLFCAPFADYMPHCCWNAFCIKHEPQKKEWARLTKKVDILMTHGPPKGVLDTMFSGASVGSIPLAERLCELSAGGKEPTYHVFGHIHEQRGAQRGFDFRGKKLPVGNPKKCSTTFINAASVNLLSSLRPGACCAIVFDLEK